MIDQQLINMCKDQRAQDLLKDIGVTKGRLCCSECNNMCAREEHSKYMFFIPTIEQCIQVIQKLQKYDIEIILMNDNYFRFMNKDYISTGYITYKFDNYLKVHIAFMMYLKYGLFFKGNEWTDNPF